MKHTLKEILERENDMVFHLGCDNKLHKYFVSELIEWQLKSSKQ